jgi:hypothetical protein
MATKVLSQEGRQVIFHTYGDICSSKRELLHSSAFEQILELYVGDLKRHDSPLLKAIGIDVDSRKGFRSLVALMCSLCDFPMSQVMRVISNTNHFEEPIAREGLHEFVEGLYNFWRSFDRFMVVQSQPGPSSLDQRPYRVFNATLESLTHLVRSAYRDLCENITGDHPRIYRQVPAGCDVGLIAVPKTTALPRMYQEIVGAVPFIRQVWIDPPMIIDPPTNKRTGQFKKVDRNPLAELKIRPDEWLCYPAQVGPLVIFVYFHQRFIGLGCSLANLFELAADEQIASGPDAVYLFGAPPEALSSFGDLPTVFFDDESNGLLAALVPGEDRFGYFGYLKKMTLTLHNIVMMKRGRMPYHGAMMRILLKDGPAANILIIGDTATGKSETLEAFRVLGRNCIRSMTVIADDMGSLEVSDERKVLGYGTEIGAFIRLDDLQQGYAFGQIDRAIIMSPQKINARVVLPVTTLGEILRGYPIDFLLYANNYEQIDDEHPVVERFDAPEHALTTFRDGTAMTKGTTTATGLVHSYFANIFGPPQYRDLHERLAAKAFRAAFDSGVFVGQLRTRLGIPGFETKGPEEAAKALSVLISKKGADQ